MPDSTQANAHERLPRIPATLLPRELLSFSLLAVALGALEGGLLGVIVKNQFSAAASQALINLAVAVVGGAAAFANLTSFYFAERAMSRGKVALVSQLMSFVAVCLLAMVFVPDSPVGLFLFCTLSVVALASWSGIMTVRAVIWRANFPRRWRGQVTARISQLGALVTALWSGLVGIAIGWHGDAWRYMFPLAALCAAAAGRAYRRSRVRRHRRLLQAEQQRRTAQGGRIRPGAMLGILGGNRDFRRYMGGMMVFGAGNLMVVPMVVVLMNDRLDMDRMVQVLVVSSLPILLLCLSVRTWARFLDRRHIVSYRALHSWTFAASSASFAAAFILGAPWLLWLASALLGLGWGGGHLGWNLGHNDFADDSDSSLYMATHVWLTGLRGLVAPVLGVACINLLESAGAGLGVYAMLLPLALNLSGWAWFVHLHRERVGREVRAEA